MAGPYYIASYTPSEIVLRRNPNYGGNRPSNAAEIDWMFQLQADAIALRVDRGDADYGIISPAATVPIAAKYGVNKSRFFVAPGYQTLCLALNTSRPLFANNPQLRRAVNFAIDRHALVAAFGAFAGGGRISSSPTDRPASWTLTSTRSSGPNLDEGPGSRGRTHEGRHRRDVRPQPRAVRHGTRADRPVRPQADRDQRPDPAVLAGRDPSRLGEPFDIADRGCGDIAPYDDPYALLNLPFDGSLIHAGSGNTNLSYFNDPAYNKKLEAAAALLGAARDRAYARLDAELARDAAPAVPYAVFNHTAFVAARIGCVKMSPIYGASFGALCLKGT